MYLFSTEKMKKKLTAALKEGKAILMIANGLSVEYATLLNQAVANVDWSATPVLIRTIDEEELHPRLLLDDRHQRVFGTVGLYADPIIAARDEDVKADIWFHFHSWSLPSQDG